MQPRPMTHDPAQAGKADPPHLGVYGKEQELRCKRQGAGWHLPRQILIGLDHTKGRWPQMCVKTCVPEPPAHVCRVVDPDDEEPVGVIRALARVAEIRKRCDEMSGLPAGSPWVVGHRNADAVTAGPGGRRRAGGGSS